MATSNAQRIRFLIHKLQETFPHRHYFMTLYSDGSGGFYEGTVRRNTEICDWSRIQDGREKMEKLVERYCK